MRESGDEGEMQKSAVRAAFNSSRDKTEDRSKQPRVRGVGEARLRHTVLIAIRGWANTLDNNPQLFHFSIMSTSSSSSLDLVPVEAEVSVIPAVQPPKQDFSPVIRAPKLHPHRTFTVPVPNKPYQVYQVMEFWRVEGPPGSDLGSFLRDNKDARRQCADITLRPDGLFNLNFYPDKSMGEPVQAVGLTMDKMPQAMQDLYDAGFR